MTFIGGFTVTAACEREWPGNEAEMFIDFIIFFF